MFFEHMKIRNSKISRFLLGSAIVGRNSPILIKSNKHHVNLNAWINPNGINNNVGDYISVVIVQAMCEYLGIQYDKKTSTTRHLYAVGSILLGYQNMTIWGSGFGFKRGNTIKYKIDNLAHKLRHSVDVRAVRGPLTRQMLNEMGYDRPEIYGDPAILLPLFYQKTRTHEKPYIVIPHYSKLDKEEYKERKDILGSFQKDWRVFVDEICRADLVISSSLHGIIIAESYGVPAVMINDTPSEDITKYKDWYYSTGRYEFPIAESINDALLLTPVAIDTHRLQEMQKKLMEAFPRDLWD